MGQCASRRQPAVEQTVLAERVATELEALRTGVVQGLQLLCDGLLVHSFCEGKRRADTVG